MSVVGVDDSSSQVDSQPYHRCSQGVQWVQVHPRVRT